MSWVAPVSNWASIVLEKKDLAKYLGKSYTIESIRYQGTPQMITAIANNELEVSNLAYSSLAIAIENAGLSDIRVIADEFQDGVAGRYSTQFYVRKDSGIQRLEELRGKTVAFVDPASSSGYIYPMVLLMKKGLVKDRDPKSFFKEALFAGTHEVALRSVLTGRVAAAVSFDKAPELHLKDPALIAQLSFVAETPEIPEAGICARPGLPADAVARIRRALLAIKGPEHAALLKQLYDIDGFTDAEDRDYEPVRDAMALMGLGRPK